MAVKTRFKLERLEERIAPSAFGGFGNTVVLSSGGGSKGGNNIVVTPAGFGGNTVALASGGGGSKGGTAIVVTPSAPMFFPMFPMCQPCNSPK